MSEQKLTGFPSIDKPWLKYYKDVDIHTPDPNTSICRFLYENNKDNLSDTALNYFGRKISFGELFENIDKVASALLALGVKPGEIVSICALNTPEFVYLLYAVNKIGAVSNWIGLTSPEVDLHNQLVSTDSKVVFTVDVAYELITKSAKDSSVEKIISVPLVNSMPIAVKTIAKMKNKSRLSGGIPWKAFIKSATGKADHADLNADDMAIIEYTGGSTGVPKGVMLSNKNLNSYYISFFVANHSALSAFNRGDVYLLIVPLFLGFGMSCCHTPLQHPMSLLLAPDPSPDEGANVVLKYRPNHITVGRLMIESLIQITNRKQADLAFLKTVLYGGE